jgi:hypothetical protein
MVLYDKDSVLIDGTVTNLDGAFEIGGIEPGDYFLVAQFLGYESRSIDDVHLQRN